MGYVMLFRKKRYMLKGKCGDTVEELGVFDRIISSAEVDSYVDIENCERVWFFEIDNEGKEKKRIWTRTYKKKKTELDAQLSELEKIKKLKELLTELSGNTSFLDNLTEFLATLKGFKEVVKDMKELGIGGTNTPSNTQQSGSVGELKEFLSFLSELNKLKPLSEDLVRQAAKSIAPCMAGDESCQQPS